jgi:hypothetical protein
MGGRKERKGRQGEISNLNSKSETNSNDEINIAMFRTGSIGL